MVVGTGLALALDELAISVLVLLGVFLCASHVLLALVGAKGFFLLLALLLLLGEFFVPFLLLDDVLRDHPVLALLTCPFPFYLLIINHKMPRDFRGGGRSSTGLGFCRPTHSS